MQIHILAWVLSSAMIFLGGLMSAQFGLQVLDFYTTPSYDPQDLFFPIKAEPPWPSWSEYTRSHQAAHSVPTPQKQQRPIRAIKRSSPNAFPKVREVDNFEATNDTVFPSPVSRSSSSEFVAPRIITVESEQGREKVLKYISWTELRYAAIFLFLALIYQRMRRDGNIISWQNGRICLYWCIIMGQKERIKELERPKEDPLSKETQSFANEKPRIVQSHVDQADTFVTWQQSQMEQILELNASQVKEIAETYSIVNEMILERDIQELKDADAVTDCANGASSNLLLETEPASL